MKNRYRVSQVVSKLISSRGRRKILKQGAAARALATFANARIVAETASSSRELKFRFLFELGPDCDLFVLRFANVKRQIQAKPRNVDLAVFVLSLGRSAIWE